MIGFIWTAVLGGLACFTSHQKQSLNHWAEVKIIKVIPNIKKRLFPSVSWCPRSVSWSELFWKGDFFVLSDQLLVMLFKTNKQTNRACSWGQITSKELSLSKSKLFCSLILFFFFETGLLSLRVVSNSTAEVRLKVLIVLPSPSRVLGIASVHHRPWHFTLPLFYAFPGFSIIILLLPSVISHILLLSLIMSDGLTCKLMSAP